MDTNLHCSLGFSGAASASGAVFSFSFSCFAFLLSFLLNRFLSSAAPSLDPFLESER